VFWIDYNIGDGKVELNRKSFSIMSMILLHNRPFLSWDRDLMLELLMAFDKHETTQGKIDKSKRVM